MTEYRKCQTKQRIQLYSTKNTNVEIKRKKDWEEKHIMIV